MRNYTVNQAICAVAKVLTPAQSGNANSRATGHQLLATVGLEKTNNVLHNVRLCVKAGDNGADTLNAYLKTVGIDSTPWWQK